MSEEKKFTVDEAGEGQRLDKWLASQMAEQSRSIVLRLIQEGQVQLDMHAKTQPSQKLKIGQQVRVRIPPVRPSAIEPQDIPLTIAYEDEYLLVIDKPADMPVHPSAGHRQQGTLVHALLHHCKGQLSGIGGEERPGIVHRLDKNTSGLILVAKDDVTHRVLSEQLKEREIKRDYMAVCWDKIMPMFGTIHTQIGRHERQRKKMAVLKKGGKEAVTHYKRIKSYYNDLFSLLQVSLETGRTHQIRVHLAHKGHPIVGDPTYGRAPKSKKLAELPPELQEEIRMLDRQLLHAWRLRFTHPRTDEALRFTSELPPIFPDFIRLDAMAWIQSGDIEE